MPAMSIGASESDIDVSLVDDILTIRADKKLRKTDDKENYHFMERSYGTFLRSLRPPYSVESDNIRADFDNRVRSKFALSPRNHLADAVFMHQIGEGGNRHAR
jgi:hypothetical protein